MTTDICFASQGELVQFVFDTFGLLPRKECRDEEFDEDAKKTFQRLLSRLAKEEGLLLKNFDTAMKTFDGLLSKHMPNQRIRQLLMTVLRDLYFSYKSLITTEGTFLPKEETLRYFISKKAIPAFVVSLNINSLRYRTFDMELQTPDEFDWFLPSIRSDGSVRWPLRKVMHWIYSELGISQTQFHYPGKSADSDSPKLQQSLDNANNWSTGENLPSLPALLANYASALDNHGERLRSDQFKNSCLIALTLARAATFIGKKLVETYGLAELQALADQTRSYLDCIEDDVDEFKLELKSQIEKRDYSLDGHADWIKACTHYQRFLSYKIQAVDQTLDRLAEASPGRPFKPEVIEALTSKYGRFAVFSRMDLRQRQMQWKPPETFFRMLSEGFRLKNDATVTWQRIDRYCEELRKTSVEDHLCWMEPWLRAVFCYRAEKFDDAMEYFEKAFLNAQYRAGKNQYKLVNQYVEVSAKLDKWQQFKKGVEWATYLGIQIRWIRDEKQTDATLRNAYNILKVANYPRL